MRKRRILNILVSIVVAGLFIWLAVRNVDLSELWEQIRGVTLGWLPFFLIVMLVSHYLRAERWRLLLTKDYSDIRRSTLFAGVMMGYFFNSLVPRLGEVTRPVYVARQHKMSSSNLIGTIVIERLFDMATLLVLALFSALYLVQDLGSFQRLFGTEGWPWYFYLVLPGLFVILAAGIWFVRKVLISLESREKISSPLLENIVQKARSFSDGIVSIRHVENWPLFLLLTAGIWFGYVIMAWLPFFMMNLQEIYGLTFTDAVVLTIVSSVGVSIPTPAGIGSYHLLIQQSLSVLYQVPAVSALTYATVAHGVTVITVLIAGPLTLWWDKARTLNRS
ncbi:lysylphosphatidylglycerol synthase transmembrane domain-containing protein [Rhodohalobacter mucosus]|uniref:TIGR00374 family protein n=1 Tax=Rhodohalobacter mucosus TaxID=2079485 RepID=A0A316TXB9_9BACT|nr:lysylphosphatidylglycerol synthase transmembrane domain-containing protein [Rhodohalobacter mucosus]PWN07925.1 TIGR00374 family protein [Rhodohalobacter mucosus]